MPQFNKMPRYKFTLLLTTSFIYLLFIIYTHKQPKTPATTKYILFWNKAGKSDRMFFPSTGRDLFQQCAVNDCFATSDRNLLPIEDFDAILFYAPTSRYQKRGTVPSKRKPKQRYVFVNFETPSRFSGKSIDYIFRNFYNWTMTYRFDSDFVKRHGYVEEINGRYELPSKEFVRSKSRNVAWMVSNCDTPGKREVLAGKLAEYIDVDVYGKCGNFSCDKSVSEYCLDMIERKYRYYLSFENSHCRDYTTEKFYNILRRNIVPIVYGGGDYKNIAPAHSYVNVEDFSDVKSLVEYLKTLADNEDSYLEYFKWKKQYQVRKDASRTMCKLCSMLHDPNEKFKTYLDINEWWFNTYNSKCLSDSTLPAILKN